MAIKKKIKKYYVEQKDLEIYIKPHINTNLGNRLFEYLEYNFNLIKYYD